LFQKNLGIQKYPLCLPGWMKTQGSKDIVFPQLHFFYIYPQCVFRTTKYFMPKPLPQGLGTGKRISIPRGLTGAASTTVILLSYK
jgi:hypothetical protein